MRKVLWRQLFFHLQLYHSTLFSLSCVILPTTLSVPAPAGTSCCPSLLQTFNLWILVFVLGTLCYSVPVSELLLAFLPCQSSKLIPFTSKFLSFCCCKVDCVPDTMISVSNFMLFISEPQHGSCCLIGCLCWPSMQQQFLSPSCNAIFVSCPLDHY